MDSLKKNESSLTMNNMKWLFLWALFCLFCYSSQSQTVRNLSIQLKTEKKIKKSILIYLLLDKKEYLFTLKPDSTLCFGGIKESSVHLGIYSNNCIDSANRLIELSKADTTHILICLRKIKPRKSCYNYLGESVNLELKYCRECKDCPNGK